MDYKKLADDLLSGCEENCADCEYAGEREFECTIAKLAATAITDLLARAEAAEARAEKAERERDAAVEDLRQMCVGGNTCAFCKHGRNCGKQGPGRKTVEPCWEWRGHKEE